MRRVGHLTVSVLAMWVVWNEGMRDVRVEVLLKLFIVKWLLIRLTFVEKHLLYFSAA